MPSSWMLVIFGLLLSPAAATIHCCHKAKEFCFSGEWVTKWNCPGKLKKNAVCDKDKCSASTGGLWGDPILTGFDNTTFEFFGSAGQNYSLLAGETFAVNIQLVEAGPDNLLHPGQEGTFVGGVGVNLAEPPLELLAYVDTLGNMTFVLNGVSQDIETPLSSHDGLVTYEPYAPDIGQILKINQRPFSVELVAVKQFSHELSGYHRGHLNVQAGLTPPISGRFWGVLGETLYNRLDSHSLDASRFETPSLSYPAPATSVTRRRLSAAQNVKVPAFARVESPLLI